MMAAHFKELLIYELWSELYDVQWTSGRSRTAGSASWRCEIE